MTGLTRRGRYDLLRIDRAIALGGADHLTLVHLLTPVIGTRQKNWRVGGHGEFRRITGRKDSSGSRHLPLELVHGPGAEANQSRRLADAGALGELPIALHSMFRLGRPVTRGTVRSNLSLYEWARTDRVAHHVETCRSLRAGR